MSAPRRRRTEARASGERVQREVQNTSLVTSLSPAESVPRGGVGPAGWAEISVNIKLLYCERRRADARRRAYCRRAAGRTNHDPSLNASVVSAYMRPSLNQLRKSQYFPGLYLR